MITIHSQRNILIANFFFLCGLANSQVTPEVTATITKSDARGPGHVSASAFPCANGATSCSVRGINSASLSDSFTSPFGQSSTAFASVLYGNTKDIPFVHPHTRLSVTSRGLFDGAGAFDAPRGVVGAAASVKDQILITPKSSISVLGGAGRIARFCFTVYEEGNLFSPSRASNQNGFHTVGYQRAFRVSSVRTPNSGTLFGFTLTPDSDEVFERSVTGGAGSSSSLEIDNIEKITYNFVTLPILIDNDAPLIFDFEYSATLTSNHIDFGRDPSTEAFGDLGNTTGIQGLELFDEDGTNITSFFSIRSVGTNATLFVPEAPSLEIFPIPNATPPTRAIRLQSQEGLTYQMQVSSSLENDSWTNIQEPKLGNGEALLFFVTSSSKINFYRVEAEESQ